MHFFPEPASGWMFLTVLMSFLAVASYFDQRTMKVPKWLTLTMLGFGLLVSMVRGGWLAAHAEPVWRLGQQGTLIGALDGFLFALCGSFLSFLMFFVMWLLGVCGGGDVKLFAALGAWIGAGLCLQVLILSLALLCVYVMGLLGFRMLTGKRVALARPGGAGKRKAAAPSGRLLVRYSLVAALASLPVLLWAFRSDLRLARPAVLPSEEVRSHAR